MQDYVLAYLGRVQGLNACSSRRDIKIGRGDVILSELPSEIVIK